MMNRSAGTLFHISSLPSPYGIGTLGREAYDFIDFLKQAGQRYWQMLPLGPTGFGDSPYQSFSSYAGNPYFIDLDFLIEDGLLEEEEVLKVSWGEDLCRVDYGILYREREALLRKAFARFSAGDFICSKKGSFKDFCRQNDEWLHDYALYMALKGYFGMGSWQEWEVQEIRLRRPEALNHYEELLEEDIRYHKFVQFLFFKQWETLRAYGQEKGIGFIGDIPIYVPLDSADAWILSGQLQLDEQCLPLRVGGVPPDCFSGTGQLWGNPLYDWAAMKEGGYSWWIRRIAASSKLFDIIRLDHFRGLESYWSIPWGEDTAINGKWVPGPGMDFIRRIKEHFPDIRIIAEDLGFLTDRVHKFVSDSGFPGMKVLQFAFESGECSEDLPHTYSRNTVVYTGTHDNTTVKGWFEEAGKAEFLFAKEYFGLSAEEGWIWGFIRGGMSSGADLFVAQMQDYLELPGSARMNIPGTLSGNWQWRLEKGQLTEKLARRMARMARMYGR